MSGLRWRRASKALCDLAAGFALAAVLYTGSDVWAAVALLTLGTGIMLDAGEPQPGDPPKRRA